jgi:enamine deaminase RidA (YjgF/YER057c/UK114 family)
MGAEARLEELGLTLPTLGAAAGAYVPAVRTGSLVFTSGHGPIGDGRIITGKVGADVDLDTAMEAARLTALQCLAAVKTVVPSLDDITRVVKVFGMVNTAPGFTDTPKVIDGCSRLLLDVFGDDVGKHARSAVGQAALPFDIAVEIELVVEVRS